MDNTLFSQTQKGWECPKCGKILAPWMPYCTCNSMNNIYTTANLDYSKTIKPEVKTCKTYISTASYCTANCKYKNISSYDYPCNICINHDMFKSNKEK